MWGRISLRDENMVAITVFYVSQKPNVGDIGLKRTDEMAKVLFMSANPEKLTTTFHVNVGIHP